MKNAKNAATPARIARFRGRRAARDGVASDEANHANAAHLLAGCRVSTTSGHSTCVRQDDAPTRRDDEALCRGVSWPHTAPRKGGPSQSTMGDHPSCQLARPAQMGRGPLTEQDASSAEVSGPCLRCPAAQVVGLLPRGASAAGHQHKIRTDGAPTHGGRHRGTAPLAQPDSGKGGGARRRPGRANAPHVESARAQGPAPDGTTLAGSRDSGGPPQPMPPRRGPQGLKPLWGDTLPTNRREEGLPIGQRVRA